MHLTRFASRDVSLLFIERNSGSILEFWLVMIGIGHWSWESWYFMREQNVMASYCKNLCWYNISEKYDLTGNCTHIGDNLCWYGSLSQCFMCVTPWTYTQNIVACQRGGVSNKPPWAPGSDKTQGQGSFGPFTGGLNLQKILKRNGSYNWPVFTKTGWTWYVTIYMTSQTTDTYV